MKNKEGELRLNVTDEGPYTITEEDLRKRLNGKTDFGRIITQIYSCFVVSMSHLSFGTCLGWASPMINKARQNQNETSGEHLDDFGGYLTWMTSMVPLGACFGFGVWTVLGFKNGPRKILLIQTFIFSVLGVIIFFAKLPGSVQASRFFLGFFGIASVVCGHMILNDTVHITLLKYFKIVPDIAVLFGVFLVQLSGIFADSRNGGLLCMGIAIITFVLLFIMPESPVYLFRKGEKFAEESLRWFIGKKQVSNRMRQIRRDYEFRNINIEDRFMLNSTVVKKSVFIIIGLVVLQVSSGYHLFLFYGTIIWSQQPLISEKADVIVLGMVLVFSRLFWSLAHIKLRFPARIPLILSCTIVGTGQLVLSSILLILSNEICIYTDYLRWCCFLSCFFIIFGLELGLSHYTNVLIYWYLPFQVYQTAFTIVNAVNWFLIFFIIKFYGFWLTRLPSWLLFCFASIVLYLGAIYVYAFVVEVKGRSLVRIQLDIGGNPIGTRAAIGLRSSVDNF